MYTKINAITNIANVRMNVISSAVASSFMIILIIALIPKQIMKPNINPNITFSPFQFLPSVLHFNYNTYIIYKRIKIEIK